MLKKDGQMVSAEGRPVWKYSGKFIFYNSNFWWIGVNYTRAYGGVKSEEENLTKIPSTGWLVQNKSADNAYQTHWVSDPSLTITDASASTTTVSCAADATTTTTTTATATTISTGNSVVSGVATVTMSPIKMELLDEYLTSQLDCPPENLQDPTTNRSVQDPSPQPPAIDLFLNPDR